MVFDGFKFARCSIVDRYDMIISMLLHSCEHFSIKIRANLMAVRRGGPSYRTRINESAHHHNSNIRINYKLLLFNIQNVAKFILCYLYGIVKCKVYIIESFYLGVAAKNMQISMAKNVNIIT